MIGRQAAGALLAALLLAAPLAARAADKGLGIAAGASLPLAPTATPGAALSLSTVLSGIEPGTAPAALLHLRGELQGIWSPEAEVGAVLPLLAGDLGLEAGPLRLYLGGGVQIFGVVWRAGYTFFSVFGLVGSGGLTLRVHPALALELRAAVTWLPQRLAARLSEPDPAPPSLPTLLLFCGLAGVVIPL